MSILGRYRFLQLVIIPRCLKQRSGLLTREHHDRNGKIDKEAEKAEHAHYARISTDRKRAAGLTRLSIWIPATDKEAFKAAADSSVARFLGEGTGQTCGVCTKQLSSRTGVEKPKRKHNQPDPRQRVLDLG